MIIPYPNRVGTVLGVDRPFRLSIIHVHIVEVIRMVKVTIYRNYVPEVMEYETLHDGMLHAFTAMEFGLGFLTKVEADGDVLWKWDDEAPIDIAFEDMHRFLEDYDEIRREVENEDQ